MPYHEPINLNELIGYEDYETICYDTIEANRVEYKATTCDLVSSYDEDRLDKLHELLDKIYFLDSSYKEAYLTSSKAGALLADFEASREAELLRELEENHERWQESLEKYRDETGNIRVQDALGDPSTKRSLQTIGMTLVIFECKFLWEILLQRHQIIMILSRLLRVKPRLFWELWKVAVVDNYKENPMMGFISPFGIWVCKIFFQLKNFATLCMLQ